MRAIFKYPLVKIGLNSIQMPAGAVPIYVGSQDGMPVGVWAIIESERPLARHDFYVYGTGQAIEMRAYLGTAQTEGGFVWHVFDAGEQA